MENPTVKNAILMVLEESDGALHLKELYREVAKLRPNTPPHSVRRRLNQGIETDDGIGTVRASIAFFPLHIAGWGRMPFGYGCPGRHLAPIWPQLYGMKRNRTEQVGTRRNELFQRFREDGP